MRENRENASWRALAATFVASGVALAGVGAHAPPCNAATPAEAPPDLPSTGHYYNDCMSAAVAGGASSRDAAGSCARRMTERMRECAAQAGTGGVKERSQAVLDCVPMPAASPGSLVVRYGPCWREAQERGLVDAEYEAHMDSCLGTTGIRGPTPEVRACMAELKTMSGEERHAQARECTELIRSLRADWMQAKPGSGSSISSCPPATRAQFEDLAVLVPGEVFLKAVTPRGAGVRIVGRVTSNRSLADSMRALLKSKDFRDPVLVSLGAVEGEGHLREFVIALSSRCPARQP